MNSPIGRRRVLGRRMRAFGSTCSSAWTHVSARLLRTEQALRSQRFRVTNISEVSKTTLTDGGQHLQQTYTLEPWLSGDYAILFILYMEDGLSQDELSRRLRVDKSYTARAVAHLEKMGMVKRKPDPHEHRIKRVFLGNNGRDMESDFFKVAKTWHQTLVKDIDPEDLAVIRAGMDKMMANAETALGLEDPYNDFNRKSI